MEDREWDEWLKKKLNFPFKVKRVQDHNTAFFDHQVKDEPLSQGHVFKVIDVEENDDFYGVIIKVREGLRVGYVPLLECELIDGKNGNFKYIKEYFEWYYEQD